LKSKGSTQSTGSKAEFKGSQSTGAQHLFAAIQSPIKKVHQKCKAAAKAASCMATTATNANKSKSSNSFFHEESDGSIEVQLIEAN
jgi:hypothetical protein